jgi:hypothetical protein
MILKRTRLLQHVSGLHGAANHLDHVRVLAQAARSAQMSRLGSTASRLDLANQSKLLMASNIVS